MADCSSNISLQPAGTQDSLCDAGNYADYVDDRNQKGLVYCQNEKNYLWNLGCVFDRAHSSFPGMYLRNRLAEYQIARIQAMFSSGSETDYPQKCCIHFGDRIS